MSGGGELNVDPGAMANGSSNLTSLAGQLQGLLDDTRSKVQTTAGHWGGQTSDAWLAKQGQWDTTATDMQQLLNDMGKHVGTSNEQYVATDGKGAASW